MDNPTETPAGPRPHPVPDPAAAAAPQPTHPRPEPVAPAPASGPTPSGPRGWLRRIRRSASATPADFEPVSDDPGVGQRSNLLNLGPFRIGFSLTLGALSAFALMVVVSELQSVVFLVVLALFLALGLNPLVERLHAGGLRRGLAVAIVALGVVAILGLALWAVVPVAGDQVTRLIQNAPTFLSDLRQNPQIAALDERFGIISKTSAYLQSIDLISTLFGSLVGAGQVVANMMFSTIMTVVLTLYFLGSMPSLKEFIYQLAPASRRSRVRYLANEIFVRIGGYLTGLFIIVTCTTLSSYVVMNVVGLAQYSLALAVVVALCAFIPMIGMTLSMTIVSIVAFSVSPTTGAIMLGWFILYMQIDSYIIQPRVFQRSVNLPGVVAILAAVSGGALYGLMGAILAVPTAAALMLLYQEVMVPALNRS